MFDVKGRLGRKSIAAVLGCPYLREVSFPFAVDQHLRLVR